MNILFLTLGNVSDLSANEIYPDLLRELHKHQHQVYVACGREKRQNLPTELSEQCGIHILRVRIGNMTKTNLIEKGISTLTVENCFRRAIDRYLHGIRFDLILYSTPPITFSSLIAYLKRRDGARTYLMLKDIFPQNAVDLEMFSTKSPIYHYFRSRERALYRTSDCIGCMSPANARYVTAHNPQVEPSKVVLCPNALELRPRLDVDTAAIRNRYNIPQDCLIFLFGGNLGKPQGIDFLISCIKQEKDRKDVFFVIAGAGTEFEKLQAALSAEELQNARLLERLSTEDYNALTSACDVGLIFLDSRFTIPNYPSRLLPYLQEGKPILAATDRVTDIRETVEDGKLGWWCPSDDPAAFHRTVETVVSNREMLDTFGKNGRAYLERHFDVRDCCAQILSAVNGVGDTTTRKRRVLLVSQCFYPSVNRGGPAVSVTNLAKSISSQFDVSVLTAAYESGTEEAFENILPGKNRLFDCDVYYEASKNPARLTELMQQAAPQTVYISSLFSAEYTLPALRYAKKHRIPAVLAPRGELQAEAISVKQYKKRPYLAFLKLSGLTKDVCFHATSTEEAERIRRYFPKAKLVIAQNLHRPMRLADRVRRKMPGCLRAVAVCRIHPIKGIDRAIEALRGVNGLVQYDIYGPTEDTEFQWKCLAAAKDLPENITVRFCGTVQPDALPAILADADVFLLPTKSENFGNAIVEAMVSGCPPIISNGTPWRDLAAHHAGANADTVADYTAALRSFAEMDELEWRQYSDGVRAYAAEKLHTDKTTATYVSMLGGTDEASVCSDKTV